MQRLVKTIEKLDDDLNGVAFAGGKKYVVGRTLPGETAELKIRKISTTFFIGKVIHRFS